MGDERLYREDVRQGPGLRQIIIVTPDSDMTRMGRTGRDLTLTIPPGKHRRRAPHERIVQMAEVPASGLGSDCERQARLGMPAN